MSQFTVQCFNKKVYCEQFSGCFTCSLFSFTRTESWGQQLLCRSVVVSFVSKSTRGKPSRSLRLVSFSQSLPPAKFRSELSLSPPPPCSYAHLGHGSGTSGGGMTLLLHLQGYSPSPRLGTSSLGRDQHQLSHTENIHKWPAQALGQSKQATVPTNSLCPASESALSHAAQKALDL